MNKKILSIVFCTLLIATALTATGAMNLQTIWLINENNYSEPYQSNTDNSGLISINIVAKIVDVSDPYNSLGGVIKVNDTIKGKYTYDSGIPDQYPDNMTVGIYGFESSSCGFEVKAGGLIFKTNPSNVNFTIEIINCGVYYGDQYSVYSVNNLQLSNGMIVEIIQWVLFDSSGTALSSDALPTTAPVLSKWNQTGCAGLMIYGYNPSDPSNWYSIQAYVTKATKSRARDVTITEHPVLIWLLEQFQNMFLLPRQLTWTN